MTFLSMDQLREVAGRTASKVLPTETGTTLPVITRSEGALRALVLYYPIEGRPPHGRPSLPSHAMFLDPTAGTVVSFRAIKPEEIGIRPPLTPVAGVHVDMSDMNAFLARRKRFFDISPSLWSAFEKGGKADAKAAGLAKEYWDLFRQVVNESTAPYYTSAAKDFFDWVHAAAGGP
jgi:hypothetical protein